MATSELFPVFIDILEIGKLNNQDLSLSSYPGSLMQNPILNSVHLYLESKNTPNEIFL